MKRFQKTAEVKVLGKTEAGLRRTSAVCLRAADGCELLREYRQAQLRVLDAERVADALMGEAAYEDATATVVALEAQVEEIYEEIARRAYAVREAKAAKREAKAEAKVAKLEAKAEAKVAKREAKAVKREAKAEAKVAKLEAKAAKEEVVDGELLSGHA